MLSALQRRATASFTTCSLASPEQPRLFNEPHGKNGRGPGAAPICRSAVPPAAVGKSAPHPRSLPRRSGASASHTALIEACRAPGPSLRAVAGKPAVARLVCRFSAGLRQSESSHAALGAKPLTIKRPRRPGWGGPAAGSDPSSAARPQVHRRIRHMAVQAMGRLACCSSVLQACRRPKVSWAAAVRRPDGRLRLRRCGRRAARQQARHLALGWGKRWRHMVQGEEQLLTRVLPVASNVHRCRTLAGTASSLGHPSAAAPPACGVSRRHLQPLLLAPALRPCRSLGHHRAEVWPRLGVPRPKPWQNPGAAAKRHTHPPRSSGRSVSRALPSLQGSGSPSEPCKNAAGPAPELPSGRPLARFVPARLYPAPRASQRCLSNYVRLPQVTSKPARLTGMAACRLQALLATLLLLLATASAQPLPSKSVANAAGAAASQPASATATHPHGSPGGGRLGVHHPDDADDVPRPLSRCGPRCESPAPPALRPRRP